jgi:hypothetical protein
MARPKKTNNFGNPADSNDTGDFVVNTDSGIKLEEIAASKLEHPLPTDPAWHDYVMMQFDEAEVDNNGYPKVSGLRRVTEQLLGEIVYSAPTPVSDSADRSCVIHTIKIRFPYENEPRVFAEIADATPDNIKGNETSKVVSKHLPATASSRAEARALRKALRLRVMSAEEATTSSADKVTNDTGYIEPAQITFIDIMCRRNKIDVWRYINSRGFLPDDGTKYTNIEKVPYDKAIKMARALTKIQNGTLQIPEDLVGYDPNWRNKGEL